jgi:hypothetical protein
MSVTYSKAGRPCFVAVIDFSNDRELALRDAFHKACASFCHRDMMALSRALNVAPITVRTWKYGLRFPRKDIAQEIIDWVNVGKPMEQRRPFPENPGML